MWRGTESKVFQVQGEVSAVCSDSDAVSSAGVAGASVFYHVQSQHSVYQEILEHFMLPSAESLPTLLPNSLTN